MKLTVRMDETGYGTVLLGDVDLSSVARKVEVSAQIGQPTVAKLTLGMVDVDVEVEVAAPVTEVEG